MLTITCKISDKLNAQLESLARRERATKSALIRRAIEQHVRRKGGRPAPRALDLVKSLRGTLHGPTDLSSNPHHLEGLGA